MYLLLLIMLILSVGEANAAGIKQQTEGWCSPAVADVKGNVRIECNGVDPKALKRLNELLDEKDEELKGKELTLQDKINEADEWARKYIELKHQLEATGSKDNISIEAKKLLEEGNFEESGKLFDHLIDKEEPEIERIASNQYNREKLWGHV